MIVRVAADTVKAAVIGCKESAFGVDGKTVGAATCCVRFMYDIV